MATTTKGVPYPLTSDNNATTTWFLNQANWIDAAPGISALTTVQRDALTGGALWVARVIYNTTTKQFEYYVPIGSVNWQVLGVPRGTILWLAHKPGVVVPGYLEVVGGTVSTTTFADLFSLVGTKYNIGGETAGTFRLPNMKRRMPVGYDDADTTYEVGDIFGNESRPYSNVQHTHDMSSHTHDIGHGHGNTNGASVGHTHGMGGHTHTYGASTDFDGGHNHGIPDGSLMWRYNPNGTEGATSTAITGQRRDNVSHSDVGSHDHAFSGTTNSPVPSGTDGQSADHVHGVVNHTGSSQGPSNNTTGPSGSATTFDIRNPAMALYPMIKY